MAVHRAVCAVADDAGWNGLANNYCAIWGNGLEAPKGESDKDDISFSIDIERGSKTFHPSGRICNPRPGGFAIRP